MTAREERLYRHLLRLSSILMLMQLDEEKGQTPVALASNLAGARRYLLEHCPALLLFTELCYRQLPIPDGLSLLAEREAADGRECAR